MPSEETTTENSPTVQKLIDLPGLSTYHTEILKLFHDYDQALEGKVNVETGKGLSTNDFTTTLLDKLNSIQANAEINQNAFSNVLVGSDNVAADAKTDTLTLLAGNNVTITANTQTGTITISADRDSFTLATDTVAGVLKLFTTIGENEDGTMTQKAITDQLATKALSTREINGYPLTANINLDADDVGAIPASMKGTADGIAELDSTGHILSSQLPASVDEIIEAYYYTEDGKFYKEAYFYTEITGERDKIYVDLATNVTYRWGGTHFVEISPSIALGETDRTAYRGDRGKIAYDHAISVHAPSDAERNAIVEIQKNGVPVTIDANRAVNITIPTSISELMTAKNFSISGGAVTNTAVPFDGSADINLNVTALNARYLTQDNVDVLILNGNFT